MLDLVLGGRRAASLVIDDPQTPIGMRLKPVDRATDPRSAHIDGERQLVTDRRPTRGSRLVDIGDQQVDHPMRLHLGACAEPAAAHAKTAPPLIECVVHSLRCVIDEFGRNLVHQRAERRTALIRAIASGIDQQPPQPALTEALDRRRRHLHPLLRVAAWPDIGQCVEGPPRGRRCAGDTRCSQVSQQLGRRRLAGREPRLRVAARQPWRATSSVVRRA